MIGVSNLMNLGLLGHDHHGVHDFENVHGMRLEDRLVEIFGEMEIWYEALGDHDRMGIWIFVYRWSVPLKRVQ